MAELSRIIRFESASLPGNAMTSTGRSLTLAAHWRRSEPASVSDRPVYTVRVPLEAFRTDSEDLFLFFFRNGASQNLWRDLGPNLALEVLLELLPTIWPAQRYLQSKFPFGQGPANSFCLGLVSQACDVGRQPFDLWILDVERLLVVLHHNSIIQTSGGLR